MKDWEAEERGRKGPSLQVCIATERFSAAEFMQTLGSADKGQDSLRRETKVSQAFLCCINRYGGMLRTHFRLKFITKETAGDTLLLCALPQLRLTK